MCLPGVKQLTWTLPTWAFANQAVPLGLAFGMPPSLDQLHLTFSWEPSQESEHGFQFCQLQDQGWHEKLISLTVGTNMPTKPDVGGYGDTHWVDLELRNNAAFPCLRKLECIAPVMERRLNAPHLRVLKLIVPDHGCLMAHLEAVEWSQFEACQHLRFLQIITPGAIICNGSFSSSLRHMWLEAACMMDGRGSEEGVIPFAHP